MTEQQPLRPRQPARRRAATKATATKGPPGGGAATRGTAGRATAGRGPARRTASSGPGPPAGRISPQVRQRRIFYRWLWLVYVPIALVPFILLVAMTGLLPHQAHFPLALLLLWDAGGIALILERRRRKITVPVPRALLAGLACLTVTGLSGSILSWMGIDRLASRGGPALLEAGGFLLLLTVFIPAFKLVDVTARSARRLIRTPRARRS